MLSGLVKFALSILFIILLASPLCRGEGGGPADYDYEIYELIDRLNKLTPQHSTLYDLLGVKSNASPEEISRQFRRLSFPFHPDKTQGDSKSTQMFNLYSGSSQVLKVPESRKRYEWILNDAPPWHRSQVYLIRQLQKRSEKRRNSPGGRKEISLIGFFAFLISSLTLTQLIIQWTRFLLNRYWIWSGTRALKSIPPQELRRMEKKAMRSDLTFLSNVDANFENLQAARSQPLPFPKPTDLFIFKWPIGLLTAIVSIFSRRPQKEAENAPKKD